MLHLRSTRRYQPEWFIIPARSLHPSATRRVPDSCPPLQILRGRGMTFVTPQTTLAESPNSIGCVFGGRDPVTQDSSQERTAITSVPRAIATSPACDLVVPSD